MQIGDVCGFKKRNFSLLAFFALRPKITFELTKVCGILWKLQNCSHFFVSINIFRIIANFLRPWILTCLASTKSTFTSPLRTFYIVATFSPGPFTITSLANFNGPIFWAAFNTKWIFSWKRFPILLFKPNKKETQIIFY